MRESTGAILISNMMRCLKRLLAVVVVGFGVSFVFGASVTATSNLSHSYLSNSTIKPGSLVSLVPGKEHYVTPANSGNGKHLLGVAVEANDSLLATDVSASKVQVALNGIAEVSVSTLNGPIGAGDQIGVSPLKGVGMKAEPGSRVVGVAQKAFNKDTTGAKRSKVHNKSGKITEVSVGFVPVVINIGTKSAAGTNNGTNGVQRFISSLVGHQVSTLSAVVSGVVALVALAALFALIFGTIRGSLISIGRNPLAKSSIFESVASVMAMSALIVGLSIIIIYLLLH